MRTLLQTRLPIPPSVNNRLIISRHGGTTHPNVVQYQQDCTIILCSPETWQDVSAIHEAQDEGNGLFVIMRFGFPQNKNPLRQSAFEIRDLDNMAQIPLNILKKHIGIDDAKVVDLWMSKRQVAPGKLPYLSLTVLEVKREALFDDDEEEEYSHEPITAPMLKIVEA